MWLIRKADLSLIEDLFQDFKRGVQNILSAWKQQSET